MEKARATIKMPNNQKGFLLILLDLLFVAIGIWLLISGLSENKNILASLVEAIKK